MRKYEVIPLVVDSRIIEKKSTIEKVVAKIKEFAPHLSIKYIDWAEISTNSKERDDPGTRYIFILKNMKPTDNYMCLVSDLDEWYIQLLDFFYLTSKKGEKYIRLSILIWKYENEN